MAALQQNPEISRLFNVLLRKSFPFSLWCVHAEVFWDSVTKMIEDWPMICNRNIAKERGTDIVIALPALARPLTLRHGSGGPSPVYSLRTIKHPMSHLRCPFSYTVRVLANKSQ